MVKEDAISTKDLFSWKAWRWSLWLAIATAIVTTVVTLLIPNQYVSEARLLPVTDMKGSGLGSLASAAAVLGVGVGGGDSGDANFIDILESRTIREKLLQTKFIFDEKVWLLGSVKHRDMALYDYLHEGSMDRAVVRLSRLISISRDLKSKVVLIRAETRSPQLSQAICRRAIQLLEQFVQERGRTKGGAKAQFAEARLIESREELSNIESRLRAFIDVNRNYMTSADPSIRLKGMRLEMEYKIQQQLVTTLVVNREQALMDEKNDIPVLNILEPGNLPQDKSKPHRILIVAVWSLLVFFGVWFFRQRKRITSFLFPTAAAVTQEV